MRSLGPATRTMDGIEVYTLMTGFNVSSQPNFSEQEAEISEYWRDRGVFSRWMDHRPDAPFFVVRENRPLPAAALASSTFWTACSGM